MAPRSTTSSFLPLSLLVILSLFTIATLASALPTSYPPSPAVFEPLFRRATSEVGPRRSIERLRLRRNTVSFAVKRQEPIGNPKARRALTSPATVAILANPKASSLNAKRAIEANIVVLNPKAATKSTGIVSNPKAKRALAERVVVLPNPKLVLPAPLRRKNRRSILSLLSSVVETVKARRHLVVLESTSTTRVVRNPKAIKSPSVAKRAAATTTSLIGLDEIIPNPKATDYSSAASVLSVQATKTATSSGKVSTSSAKSSSKATSTSSSKVSSSSSKTSSKASSSKAASTSSKASSTSSKASSTSSKASSTKASVSATASSVSWPAGDMISAAYYPDWDGDLIPPSQVDFSLFDLLDFAFAIPTSDYGIEFTQDNSAQLLEELVSYAHGNNTKILVSIGGWSDSTYFSGAVSTAANRALFVKNIVAMANTYDIDGIDIDWEYPGGGGADGNEQATTDTANFLLFLTSLRAALGSDKRISACTTETTFIGADGNPLTDVSTFAAVLDNILVMNYDVWGASSTPGPNAPLSDACANSEQPNANELSAIETWTAAGMPASKILMGVPSYGYISSSTATTLVHKRSLGGVSNRERAMLLRQQAAESRKSVGRRAFERGQINLAKRKAVAAVAAAAEADTLTKRGTIIFCPNNHSGNPCAGIVNQTIDTINWNPLNTTINSNGTVSGGVFGGGVGIGKLGDGNLAAIDSNEIEFYQLLSYGVIVEVGTTGNYTGTNGYTRAWDDCSSTPYLYDVAREVVITYDDPESMTLKAQLAKKYSIAGINMWDISGDTPQWTIVKSFRAGMGLTN